MWMIVTLMACAGVTVSVENQTDEPVTNVSVEVTGETYNIGTLNPGDRTSVRVQPTGESAVVVIGTRDGAVDRVSVPVYFEESHYQGTVSVGFQPEGEALIESDIRIGRF